MTSPAGICSTQRCRAPSARTAVRHPASAFDPCAPPGPCPRARLVLQIANVKKTWPHPHLEGFSHVGAKPKNRAGLACGVHGALEMKDTHRP